MRSLGAFTLLAPIWAASSRLYGPAGFLLAVGFSTRLVPVIERHAEGFRRLVRVSLPLAAALVPVLAASLWVGDLRTAWREEARPLPPSSSPNILLIVLDTVGAEHLGLYGYSRSTSRSIDELAARGIRFDQAQSASSWTLPSHASMFTGRWPHELSAGWFTPLDGTVPTLAEVVGSHGYATAGFVANTWYCARDSGLGRGFTNIVTSVSPGSPRSPRPSWSIDPWRGYRRSSSFSRIGSISICSALPSISSTGYSNPVARRPRRWTTSFLTGYRTGRSRIGPSSLSSTSTTLIILMSFQEEGIHRFGGKARNEREKAVIRDWPRVIQNGAISGPGRDWTRCL